MNKLINWLFQDMSQYKGELSFKYFRNLSDEEALEWKQNITLIVVIVCFVLAIILATTL
jgi:hypothetical protein